MEGLWLLPILSLPHIFYFVLWTQPQLWLAVCKPLTEARAQRAGGTAEAFGNEACMCMSVAAHFIKALQFSSCVVWFWTYSPSSITLAAVMAQPAWRLVLGVLGLLAGQSLNAGIYAAIGRNGVYYGNRFGAKLGPWVTGFPFNIPIAGRHPQYTGVLLSIWGAASLCSDKSANDAGFLYFACAWSAFYVFTSIIEQSENTERPKAS